MVHWKSRECYVKYGQKTAETLVNIDAITKPKLPVSSPPQLSITNNKYLGLNHLEAFRNICNGETQ